MNMGMQRTCDIHKRQSGTRKQYVEYKNTTHKDRKETSFHATLHRVLGNCHQILFKLGHIFPTISINEDLALILAL